MSSTEATMYDDATVYNSVAWLTFPIHTALENTHNYTFTPFFNEKRETGCQSAAGPQLQIGTQIRLETLLL